MATIRLPERSHITLDVVMQPDMMGAEIIFSMDLRNLTAIVLLLVGLAITIGVGTLIGVVLANLLFAVISVFA